MVLSLIHFQLLYVRLRILDATILGKNERRSWIQKFIIIFFNVLQRKYVSTLFKVTNPLKIDPLFPQILVRRKMAEICYFARNFTRSILSVKMIMYLSTSNWNWRASNLTYGNVFSSFLYKYDWFWPWWSRYVEVVFLVLVHRYYKEFSHEIPKFYDFLDE